MFKIRLPKKIKKITLVLIVAPMLYAATFGVLAYGVYSLGWYGATTGAISRVFPLPVMIVNYRPIYFSEFHRRELGFTVRILEQLNEPGYLKTEGGLKTLNEKQAFGLDILISEEFVRQYAELSGIDVEDDQVDEVYDKLVAENGGEETWNTSLKQDLGWSPNYFKRILKLELVKEKMNESLCTRDDEERKKLADEVLELSKAEKADFDALARQFSEHETAEAGGLIGAIEIATGELEDGEMDPELSPDVFSFIESGQQGAIELKKGCAGYLILKMDKKSSSSATVRVIVVSTMDVTELEEEWRSRSRIIVLPDAFYYDEESGSVKIKE